MLFQKISAWATALQLDVLALWLALKHPEVSAWAKAISFVAVAYALIPIDVLHHSRAQAVEWLNNNQSKPRSYVGLLIVLAIWLICLACLVKQLGAWT